MKAQYLYFEATWINIEGESEPPDVTIRNENILVNKPRTNSLGYWGFSNFTKRSGFDPAQYLTVNQYWVDLNKFQFDPTGINTMEEIRVAELVKAVKPKLQINDDRS